MWGWIIAQKTKLGYVVSIKVFKSTQPIVLALKRCKKTAIVSIQVINHGIGRSTGQPHLPSYYPLYRCNIGYQIYQTNTTRIVKV